MAKNQLPRNNASVNQEQPNATVNQSSNASSNPPQSSEEIAAAAIKREKDLAFKGMILKHGLNVDILSVDSCKRIIDFLEKSEDRRIQNQYVRGYKQYRDLAYSALDELLELLYNYTLDQIQSTHPGRLKELIVKLNCHSLGGEWLKDLEDTLSSVSGEADFDRLNQQLTVLKGDISYLEKTRERVSNSESALENSKVTLENRLKAIGYLKRKYPF
jgi:hypothetical protein